MRVVKVFQWDAAHFLELPYASKCANIHGHTYKIEVELEGSLNEEGMVMDFVVLKQRVEQIGFDHQVANDVSCMVCGQMVQKGWMGEKNPTAENMVNEIHQRLLEQWNPGDPHIRRIRVWETPNSYAEEIWEVKDVKKTSG